MKTLIIDANGYLRLFLHDVPDQTSQIEHILQQAQLGTLTVILPEIIVFELAFTLEKYYKVSKLDLVDSLKGLISTPYLQVESHHNLLAALRLYAQSTTSLVDCYLFCKARAAKAELFIFDKKLQKMKA